MSKSHFENEKKIKTANPRISCALRTNFFTFAHQSFKVRPEDLWHAVRTFQPGLFLSMELYGPKFLYDGIFQMHVDRRFDMQSAAFRWRFFEIIRLAIEC